MTKPLFKMTEWQYNDYQNDSIGLCILCKSERDCCEPDAREYQCEECGKLRVYGVPELLMMGLVEIIEGN